VSRIDQAFAQLRTDQRKAFVPFVTAGDPDLEFTGELLATLDRQGASLLEVGFPYSDPIADGPVIQASYTRALAQGLQVEQIFQHASQWQSQLTAPLVAMVSYAIIHRRGPERFLDQACQAGFAGAIVPDLLVEEADAFRQLCDARDFSLIQLVTPTTPRERAVRIAESSSGFLYYVSVTGITGERRELPSELVDQVGWLREQTELPICIGFGISSPEQVAQLREVADGVIVGSALVRCIADGSSDDRQQVLENVGKLASQLIEAL
jgi:tryptophan synthase alpha chain